MSRRIPVVAIVGRTNVGKSSLFNALVGRRLAVIEDEPGVTRDRNYAHITRYDFPFTLIDTGGLMGEEEGLLRNAVRSQAELAIRESDLVLAVFDGINGPHPHDDEVVDILRRSGKPVLWVINKTEHTKNRIMAAEFHQLGIDPLVLVAAAHRVGIKELVESMRTELKISNEDIFEELAKDDNVVRIAVIGKPNVGKSTFINKILGTERLVTSPLPGTTRDTINVELAVDGQKYLFMDTAGLRRKARVDDMTPERYANLRTLRALAMCDVAVVLLDATEGMPTDQDARIAGLAHERGRGLVIVVNKWDQIEKETSTALAYRDAVYDVFKFAKYAPVLFISALTGQRCPNVLRKAKEIYDTSRVRIPTGALNRLLSNAFQSRPPPVYHGEPIKLFFATQVEVAPPAIVLFVNHPGPLSFGYERYLKNALRQDFPFEGVDVKLRFRKRTAKAHERGKGRDSVANE